jgi:hypothetical protein
MDKLQRLKSINTFDEKTKNDLLYSILEDIIKYQYGNPTDNTITIRAEDYDEEYYILIETDKDYGVIIIEGYNVLSPGVGQDIFIRFKNVKSTPFFTPIYENFDIKANRHVLLSFTQDEYANDVPWLLTFHESENIHPIPTDKNTYTRRVTAVNAPDNDSFFGTIKIYYTVL